MANSFNLFPVMDDNLYSKIGYEINTIELSYYDDGETHDLNVDDCCSVKKQNGVATIEDPRYMWDPETHNLKISKSIKICNPQLLFGENGIATDKSVLGLAMMWISNDSDQRGIVPFCTFTKSDNEVSAVFNKDFKKSQLRGSITLQTAIYLISCDEDPNLTYMAKDSGTILGLLDSLQLLIDGDGSTFPIVTVSEPGEPLWSVFYNKNADPIQDKFDEENVYIKLNDKHPNYDALKVKENFKDSQIFIEVLSSALMVIVQSVKDSLGEEWDAMLSSGDFAPASIAQAVYVFVHDLKWDVSSPTALSVSIRKFFDNKLQ